MVTQVEAIIIHRPVGTVKRYRDRGTSAVKVNTINGWLVIGIVPRSVLQHIADYYT